MPLNTPDTVDEVIDRAVNDVFLALAAFGAKPALGNSYLNATIVAYSNRIFDEYFALDQAALEALPDTAVDNLDRWGAIYKVTPNPGHEASGLINATGELGTVVPEATVYVIGSGFEYQTIGGDVSVSAKVSTITLLTRDGTTATATTADPHNLSNNVPVTILDADQTDYNVVLAAIVVLSATAFSFEVANDPVTPATGSISANFETATVTIESDAFSDEANQAGLAGFQLEGTLVGIDEDAGATFPGITGGIDQEEREAFRTRMLDRIQNPVAHFNVADIVFTAKKVPGVTRVFVFEITPSVGQVTVYFMRDGDDTTAVPDSAEVAEVKSALDTIRPANTAPNDLIVLAPIPMPSNFIFTELTPNTSSMKSAIIANLTQYFKEGPIVGENVQSDAYRSVIFNTVDTTNGARVESFTLTEPSGDILVTIGEIATLGEVTI